MNDMLTRPAKDAPASLFADLVYEILTDQGAQFASDPKPLIQRLAEMILKSSPEGASVNQVLGSVLKASCNAFKIDYSFEG